MWKPSVILALAICTFFTSADAQDTCGSPTTAPGDSTSTVPSNPGVFYFYPTPFSPSCVGTVVAYEFCYRYTRTSGSPDDVVSIVVLESVGGNYRVVWTGDEMEGRNCVPDTMLGFDRCCGRTELTATDEVFTVSTNHAYGFVMPGSTQNVLLTLETSAPGYNLSAPTLLNNPGNLPAVNSTLTPVDLGISGMQLQDLQQRSVQFIIQPPSSSGGTSGGTIAAAVIIPLLVIGGVAVTMVIIIVLWKKRYRKSETLDDGQAKGNSYANAIYEGTNGHSYPLEGNFQKTATTSSDPHSSTQSVEDSHEYAVPDQAGEFPKGLDQPEEYLESVPGPTPYAITIPGSNQTMPEITTVADSGPHHSPSTLSAVQMTMMARGRIDPYGSLFGSERGSVASSVRQGSVVSTYRDPENIYMVPANDEKSLYDQIKTMNLRHIKRDTVKITDHLGSGQFGTVNRGEWESPDGPVEVAVKVLKTDSAQDDKVKFLQEAAIMGQFKHNNVVQLYGVVIIGEPKMIVLELLEKGDLHNYLKSLQLEGEEVNSELPHMLLSFSRQVASGLAYLAGKAFVHRDLAARNVLVAGDGETIKIADFGMSRDLMDENYYVAHGGKIPVKWTAPEAIHFKKYSTASDVWSFGAVMYEIWSLGYKPFQGYSNGQAMNMVDSKMRLPPPPGCPRAIYDIMIKCWHPDAAQRPDAAKIAQWLSRPDPQLLKWSEEDRAIHPEASLLGAELEAAVELYKELQETYVNKTQ